MRQIAAFAVAALLASCAPPNSNSIGAGEAQQLILTALSNDIRYAREGKHAVCVQRELEPPLHDIRENWKLMGPPRPGEPSDWIVGEKPADARLTKDLERALKVAATGHGVNAPISEIASLPAPLILFSKRQKPRECDPGASLDIKPNGPFLTYLSRPVIADSYAFIEYSGVCGGLCGGGSIQAFKKQDGHWIQVATKVTWIS